jgi:hypothetical protein
VKTLARYLAARFTRALSPLRRRDEGAVVAIVAVLMGSAVMFALSAVVVDIGQIYVEREQLQSGAEAAAMSVARRCLVGTVSCANPTSIAQQYANANANDGISAVTMVCGRGGGLTVCPTTSSTALAACLGSAPTAAPYVEVHTATQLPDGTTLLPPTFAGAVMDNYRGARYTACARVATGAAVVGKIFAVTVSTCDWNTITNYGASYQPAPPALPSADVVIRLRTQGQIQCSSVTGWDPGSGYGWTLLDDSLTCTTTLLADGTYPGASGNGAPWACSSVLDNLRTTRTPILIPFYDGVHAQGSTLSYHLAGIGVFVVTGWALTGGGDQPSSLTGQTYCTGNLKCLYGYFISKLVAGQLDTTRQNYGALDIGVIG